MISALCGVSCLALALTAIHLQHRRRTSTRDSIPPIPTIERILIVVVGVLAVLSIATY